jgi:hypothetical protein
MSDQLSMFDPPISPGSSSFDSASLRVSLESRLRARLVWDGGTGWRFTWKSRVTPSQRSICALRASKRFTTDPGSGLWLPTPVATDGKGSPAGEVLERRRQNTRGVRLEEHLRRLGYFGKLNPAFVARLMHYPDAWDDCGVTAMRSIQRSRPSS